MHKSIKHVNFEADSVLTNSPWSFVELWLKQKGDVQALAHWLQARRFAEAANSLSVEAAPLPLYYSFLNATKALLILRGAAHGKNHGVGGDRDINAKTSLSNEIVKFQDGGVLPDLCRYLGDSVTREDYDLGNLLWNLPFIHRAFCHTYPSKAELFIPLDQLYYVSPSKSREAWFQARVVSKYADGRILKSLPSSFTTIANADGETYIRREKRFRWLKGHSSKTDKMGAIKRLATYHGNTRREIVPISGPDDFWYIKKTCLTIKHRSGTDLQ